MTAVSGSRSRWLAIAEGLRCVRDRAIPTLRDSCLFALISASVIHSQPAHSQKVRVTDLSDVNFGTIANLATENRRSQSICVFSNSLNGAYSVSASGSGTGAGFTLSSGSFELPYEVMWSSASGQTSGILLSPNVALTGQTSVATQQSCNSGPAASASLTIVLRASALSQAREGSYSGSLTLLLAAE